MKMWLVVLFGCLCVLPLSAQTPDWVISHPVSDKEYIGVGMASLQDNDYMRKATQNALADIAGQISNRIEVSSFMRTVDVDAKSRELFEEKIQGSMTAYLDGHHLKDSYQDNRNYYVCYVLDKSLYEMNLISRRNKVLRQGLDFYNKGVEALEKNSLVNAVQLFGKGLEMVEPWVFLDLITEKDGKPFDVAAELYAVYCDVFDGLAITVNNVNVDGQFFKPIAEPIAACLSRNGEVVPNVKLKAKFVAGDGEVTPAIATDYNGTSEFYVTNIVSKLPVQELQITIDDTFKASLPESFHSLISSQMWPMAKVTITLGKEVISAYLHVNEDGISSMKPQLSSLLVNNYFVLTEYEEEAECYMELFSNMTEGGIVTGGLYDLKEYYCSLALKIYDKESRTLLLDYILQHVRVLAPFNKSKAQIEAMCTRELMKRINRELPDNIKKMNLNN